MDTLTAALYVGIACLVGIAVDTYFWVRTTLRLRDYERELEPRLEVIDDIADQLPALLPGLGSQSASKRVPLVSAKLELRRTKKGVPFVVIDGKARFLNRAQARAIEAGRPVPGIDPRVPPGAAGLEPPPSPVPTFNENPPPSSEGFDFAAAAAELGVSEDMVRSFYSRHSGQTSSQASSENEGGDQIPRPGLDNRPAGGDSVGRLVRGLLDGNLDLDAAKGLAGEVLYGQQVEAQGGPSEWAI